MSENTANIYAYLKQKYPQYKIIHNAYISYLNTLEEATGKIIFLCEEQENLLRKPFEKIMPISNKNQDDEDLEVTGSPLKDECDFDIIDMSEAFRFDAATPWLEAEESYKGIDLSKCRNILSDLVLQTNGADSGSALWILCNAMDADKTLLQMIQFNRKLNCRGLVVYRGLKLAKEIDITLLIKNHLRKVKYCTKVDTSVDSFFSINPCMSLKLSTTSTSLTPNIDDFRNSETILFQTVKIGDADSIAEDFWRQLSILSHIKDDIVEFKNNDDITKDIEYKYGRGIELEIVQKKVIATLTDLSAFDYAENSEESYEIEAVIQRAKLKTTNDVTDKLWEILKCCSSYKDLKAGFNIVFQCAAKCNIVNPPTNNNRLAEIIREVSERRLAIPCLTGSEPLELLLEIGLEKIQKDYEYIFTESKICGKNDLEINKPFNKETNVGMKGDGDTPRNVRKSLHNAMQTSVNPQQRVTLLHTNNLVNHEENDVIGFQNSKFDRREIDYKLSRLAQIHLVLEHLLQIQVNLNLENVYNEICERLLNRPVQPFDVIKDAVFDRIEIPIVTDHILSRLESDPNARRIVMLSKNKFKEIQTTYYFNMDNIFPSGTFNTEETDEKEYGKENTYYCWEYLKLSTRRC